MFKYYFFNIGKREVYLDLKSNRPWTIEIYKDKNNGDINIWVANLYLVISYRKPSDWYPPTLTE